MLAKPFCVFKIPIALLAEMHRAVLMECQRFASGPFPLPRQLSEDRHGGNVGDVSDGIELFVDRFRETKRKGCVGGRKAGGLQLGQWWPPI
jgi:hypothetical protein